MSFCHQVASRRLTRSICFCRYGFLEGIWYLDILHHGHVPKTNSSSLYNFDDDEEEDENDVNEAESHNEDEREEAEMKRLERRLEQTESQEQKDYKAEFFELLDEVRNLSLSSLIRNAFVLFF